MRSTAAIETVQALIPDPVAVGLLVVTVLGNPFVVPPVLLGVYWFGDHRQGARLLGVVAGGLALTLVVKELIAFPRPPASPPIPPESLPAIVRAEYAASVHPDTRGFPSGHAATATLLWGALALAFEDVSTRSRRFAAAGVVVVLVALSRVVMGVHYPADVVAGVVFGAVYLLVAGAVLARVSDESTSALALSVVLAAVAVVVTGPRPEAVVGAGIVLGSLVGWYLADGPRPPWSRLGDGTHGAVGGLGLALVVGGGWVTVGASVAAAFLVPAVTLAAALAVPRTTGPADPPDSIDPGSGGESGRN